MIDYSMDGYLKKVLDTGKELLPKDWDMVFLVDGFEGTGKSVNAQQMAKYVDDSFCIDRIVFTPNSFKKAVINAEKFQAVVYDEAYTGLSSRGAMSQVNKILVSMLAEIRQKNLFVFIVMPTFFDLDKYVAIWRSRALVHCYTGDNFQRGFFAFYDIFSKKDLYINGKKFYSYGKPKPNFIGRFVNHYTVDEAEYKAKKRKSLTDRETQVQEKENEQALQQQLIDRVMALPDTIPHSVKIQVLDMPSSTYYLKLKQKRELEEI